MKRDIREISNMKKIGFALDAVASFLFNMIDLLVFEFLLHRTARIVVPLISFGRVKVEEIYTDTDGFNCWVSSGYLPVASCSTRP